MTIPNNLGGMPATFPATTTVGPSLGEIIYLASYIFQVDVTAVQTFDDTPNQYSANIGIMGDQGQMSLDALVGQTGPAGRANFTLRDQTALGPLVNNVSELPTGLTDTLEDVGKYWLLNTLNEFGFVIMVTAYVWYGNEWRAFMMGEYGPPGPLPDVQPTAEAIAPSVRNAKTGLPQAVSSSVKTSGPTTAPRWEFKLAVPAGPSGPVGLLAQFPDVDETTAAPQPENLLTFAGEYNDAGFALWRPFAIDQGIIGPFSMPESAFSPYYGFSQQALIGQYALPSQPFPWTPIVWGHVGGTGIELSGTSSMIGCQVLLGDPNAGTQIGRGLGNTLGIVNVMPHYSGLSNTSTSITPLNLANLKNAPVVPANHTGNAGTVYVSLWNDGALGAYLFSPQNAQLFIMVMPVNPPFQTIIEVGSGEHAIITGPATGHGALSATRAFGAGITTLPGHAGNLHGRGHLSASANIHAVRPFVFSGGHGTLTATVRLFKINRSAALSGTGVLRGLSGFGQPPLFDTVGTGSTGASNPTSLSEIHIIHGNCIIAAVTTFTYETATCKVGSTPMVSLGFAYNDNNQFAGGIQFFYLLNSGLTGSQTITASFASAPGFAILNTLSFYNVHGIGAAQTTYGYTQAMTQSVTSSTQGIAVQAFSCYMFGGSQSVTAYSNTLESYQTVGATLAQLLGFGGHTVNLTFTATSSEGNNYAGIAVVLT